MCGRPVRQTTGEREVEAQSQGVYVGAGIAAAAGENLRRGVGERARECPGAGDAELPVELGGTEIRETGTTVGLEEDVGRLHVAVENAAPVSGGQRGRDIAADLGRELRVERTPLAHTHLEIGARHVLHHDEAPRAVFQQVEHRDDVRVRESAHYLHFSTHPLAGEPGRRRGWHEELDRHVGTDRAVAREIDDRVAAPTELATHFVPVEQHGAWREERRRRHFVPSRPRTSRALARHPSSFWYRAMNWVRWVRAKSVSPRMNSDMPAW